VLRDIPLKFLKKIAVAKQIDVRVSSKLKNDEDAQLDLYVDKLSIPCIKEGIKSTMLEFPKKMMSMLTSKIDDEFMGKNDNNTNNNAVLRKRCYEKMIELTVRKFFETYVTDVKDLRSVVEYFGRKPWSKDNSEVLIDQINEIFETGSLSQFLGSLDKDLLQQICEAMKFKFSHNHSARILADCIIYGTNTDDSHESEEEVKLELSKKVPKNISDKCTRDDLIYQFTISDLQDFCKESGMISSGKKVQIVNRILEFFDDPESALSQYNPEKRKERRQEKTQQKNETRERNKIKMENLKREREEKRKESQSVSQSVSQDIDEQEDEEVQEDKQKGSRSKNLKSSKKSTKESPKEVFDGVEDNFESGSEEDKENFEDEPKQKRSTTNQKGRVPTNKRVSSKKKMDELSESTENLRVGDDESN